MKKLFDDFDSIDLEQFEKQLIKDLRGEPLASLMTHPENGIELTAYSHRDENIQSNNITSLRKNNAWVIRVECDAETSNEEILTLLNTGVTGIGLDFKHELNFQEQTKGVLFEHIHTDIHIPADQIKTDLRFHQNVHTKFDPITIHLKAGNKLEDLNHFHTYFHNFLDNQSIWVEGKIYGDAGASTLQELAATLAHYNEYLTVLEPSHHVENLISKSVIELSITENYFLNIAKFRAIRILLATLFKGYGYEGLIQPKIAGTSSIRSLTSNDANNNLLRGTTQGMSAILGGCDILTIRKMPLTDKKLDHIHERMVKNISLILAEEAYFDKVGDVGAGSYYIEKLTNQLVKKAWEKFQDIEKMGGFIAMMNQNTIQTDIFENRAHLIAAIKTKSKTLLGVNKFQNNMEDYIAVKANKTLLNTLLTPLTPLSLEANFSSVQA